MLFEMNHQFNTTMPYINILSNTITHNLMITPHIRGLTTESTKREAYIINQIVAAFNHG